MNKCLIRINKVLLWNNIVYKYIFLCQFSKSFCNIIESWIFLKMSVFLYRKRWFIRTCVIYGKLTKIPTHGEYCAFNILRKLISLPIEKCHAFSNIRILLNLKLNKYIAKSKNIQKLIKTILTIHSAKNPYMKGELCSLIFLYLKNKDGNGCKR